MKNLFTKSILIVLALLTSNMPTFGMNNTDNGKEKASLKQLQEWEKRDMQDSAINLTEKNDKNTALKAALKKKMETSIAEKNYYSTAESIVSLLPLEMKDSIFSLLDLEWKNKLSLSGHSDTISFVAFNAQGTQIVTGSWDKTARIWNTQTGTPGQIMQGHKERIISAIFNQDSTKLITGSVDKTAKIWDTSNGQCLATINHMSPVARIALSPDGKRMLTQTNSSYTTGDEIANENDLPTRIQRQSADEWSLLWNFQAGTVIVKLPGRIEALSPDGTKIITSKGKIWDADTGLISIPLQGNTNIMCSAFSPDSAQLVTGLPDNSARIWNVQTGEAVSLLQGHKDLIRSVAFNTDGTQIATGSDDSDVKIWNKAGQCLITLQGHPTLATWFNSIKSAIFILNGRQILTTSEDNTVKIWDTQTGVLVQALPDVEHIAINNDNTRIVTVSDKLFDCDYTAKIWKKLKPRTLAIEISPEKMVKKNNCVIQ